MHSLHIYARTIHLTSLASSAPLFVNRGAVAKRLRGSLTSFFKKITLNIASFVFFLYFCSLKQYIPSFYEAR